MSKSPKKQRVPLSPQEDAEVLFLSDHACCKCRDYGRPVQIHHIDEDPSNNSIANLAVLCLLCHNETMATGGFGKKLKEQEVVRYRDDWIARVSKRRDEADKVAIHAMTPVLNQGASEQVSSECRLIGPDELVFYVYRIPFILEAAYLATGPLMAGTTADMVAAAHEVIDVLVQVLIRLSMYYPANHFGDVPAEDYFSKYVSERAIWCRAIVEPDGYGNGGSIARVNAAHRLLKEIESAVASMVHALFYDMAGENSEALESWDSQWQAAMNISTPLE